MYLSTVVRFVLVDFISFEFIVKFSPISHIVIVCLTHLQPAIALWKVASITIADDILERITATPFAMTSSDILFHWISFGEVVP